jgi:hypothetical protein
MFLFTNFDKVIHCDSVRVTVNLINQMSSYRAGNDSNHRHSTCIVIKATDLRALQFKEIISISTLRKNNSSNKNNK